MYRLYERIQKSEQYKYGSKPVEGNPFEGPCLLCVSALYNASNNLADKSNYGISKIGMEMAGLRTRGHNSAGFDIEKFPVKFLSIITDHSDEIGNMSEEDRIDDFVETYLIPLISKNGKKIDSSQAMKNMRNVNMMSFCDGTVFVQNVERTLIERMEGLGYQEQEYDQILSQMCIFPFATNRLTEKEPATCVSFKDVNDSEVDDDVTDEEKRAVWNSQTEGKLFKYSDNEMAYLVSGEGDHKLTGYAREGKILSASVTSVIGKALQSSIENAKGEEFIPITAENLTEDIPKFEQMAQDGKTAEEIMSEVCSSLQYDGARRLSQEEMDRLDELDKEYDEMLRAEPTQKFTIAQLTKNAMQQGIGNTQVAAADRTMHQRLELENGFSIGGDL